jgi:hypothetical protein
MANPIFGEARLPLADGRELTLRFDFAALAEAEDAADKGTEEMIREMSKGGARLKTARAMLFGALRHHHPEVSLSDAGDLLLTDSNAVSEAMGRAMEQMADRRAEQNPSLGTATIKAVPSRGIGTRSSKHGAKAA